MKKIFLRTFTVLVCLGSSILFATAATVFSSTSSLTGFSYTAGSGPSAEQTFTVSGTNLSANLVVTAPTNYEISPLSGSSFVSMGGITIAHSAGTVSEITLYVRLKAGLTVNVYSGNLTISSNGAQTQNIALSGSVLNPPSITTSVSSVTGLFNFYDIGQSVEKTILVSGSDLKAGLVLSPSYNFEISRSSGYGFTNSSITLPLTGTGVVASTIIYVRLYPYTYPSYDYNGTLTITSTGATAKTVSLTGRSSYKPIITSSKTTITGLNYFLGSGPSTQQSFTVSATNLTDAVVISAPTNYEISTTGGTAFVGQTSITLNGSYYNLATTTIYVRLKSGLTANSYTGNLTCTSGNAVSKTISLSGSVTSQPVVNVSTSNLTGFRYNIGSGPSTENMFTVSGTSLSSLIFIYAPTNYEISTSGGSAFSATSSIILPQSGGSVASTNIYVRLKAGLTEGSYNESVTIASTGTTNQLVSLVGSVVNPNGLTVSETAFTGMDYLPGNGPSSEKLFTVSGSSIGSIVIITAPDNFEISTYSGSSFQGSQQLILQPVSGILYTKNIYVRLKSGLSDGSYTGTLTISTAGYPTKNVSLSGSVTNPVVLIQDQAYYEPRNNGAISLKNNWLFSQSLGNYNSADLLGSPSTVRGMVARNGKMLFCSRSTGNQLIIVDGKTAVRKTVNLASNVFTYSIRNYSNTADSIISVSFPCNDIKVDKGGNVLVSNVITNSASRFQVWNVNPDTGSGTILIDQSDLSILFPGRPIRLETFSVLGDINTTAFIYAVSSSVSNFRDLYKWTVTGGIASKVPEIVNLDAAPEPAFGNGAIVYPIDEENFYIDADKIMPFKYNINSRLSDSFKNYTFVYTDTITTPLFKSKINQTVNGITEFTVGTERFLALTVTSYLPTSYNPPAAFRIYKYPPTSDKIADLQCLWTFPLKGMGTTLSANRNATTAVEVSDKKATIYIYYPENGYGVYEMNVGIGTDTQIQSINQDMKLEIEGNNIVNSEILCKIEIYTVTGQLLKSVSNTNSILKPKLAGVYIVKTVSTSGVMQSQKIILQ